MLASAVKHTHTKRKKEKEKKKRERKGNRKINRKRKKIRKKKLTRRTCSFISITTALPILSTLAGNNLLMGK